MAPQSKSLSAVVALLKRVPSTESLPQNPGNLSKATGNLNLSRKSGGRGTTATSSSARPAKKTSTSVTPTANNSVTQTPKTSPTVTPTANNSDTQTPKMSPKTAPKAAPKAAPKTAPKATRKTGQKAGPKAGPKTARNPAREDPAPTARTQNPNADPPNSNSKKKEKKQEAPAPGPATDAAAAQSPRSSTKPSAYKGRQRPTGPRLAACDVPLCSVQPGETRGTYWYVSEMASKAGGICKAWKYFAPAEVEEARAWCAAQSCAAAAGGDSDSSEDAALCQALEHTAWQQVQRIRATRGDSLAMQMKYLTPEQDRQYLLHLIGANNGELPSVTRNKVKFARLRDRRRNAGIPLDGRQREFLTFRSSRSAETTKTRRTKKEATKAAGTATKKATKAAGTATKKAAPSAQNSKKQAARFSFSRQDSAMSCATVNSLLSAEGRTSATCQKGETFFPAGQMELHGLTAADLVVAGYSSVRVCENGTGAFVVPA